MLPLDGAAQNGYYKSAEPDASMYVKVSPPAPSWRVPNIFDLVRGRDPVDGGDPVPRDGKMEGFTRRGSLSLVPFFHRLGFRTLGLDANEPTRMRRT